MTESNGINTKLNSIIFYPIRLILYSIMKLIIQLVTWNGKKYIPYLFESLRKQTFSNFHLYILDNGSTDGTQDTIEKELHNFKFEHTFIRNEKNIGFAGGHNQVFKDTKNNQQDTNKYQYVLLLNQDMYLTSDCIEKMVKFFDANRKAAAVSPRLMRWDFKEINSGLEKTFTHTIDSLGLKIFRNRRVIEKYVGKVWEDKKSRVELSYRTSNDAMEVFGVSGAFPMFRRSALEAVSFGDGNFFDDNYGSYKEDVDLAYRLQIAGFHSYVLLDVIAYHDRTAPGIDERGKRIAVQHKRSQSEWVKYHSYKNHIMTLYTNEYSRNLALDFPWIIWYELQKFVYFLLFDRAILKGLFEIKKNRKKLKQTREEVKEMRRVSSKELRIWWS